MKRRILISEIIVAFLLLSGAPMMTQDTALAQNANATGQTLVVSKFTDSADGVCDADCSLREAIGIANQTPGTDMITLSPGVYQLEIPPGEGGECRPEDENNDISDLDIYDDLILIGAGALVTTLDSDMGDRLIDVQPTAEVRINNLAIRGGDSHSGGGGLANAGILTLENVRIVANHAGGYECGGSGGGIDNSGSLTIRNSQILDNFAGASGSGAGSGGGIANDGVLKVYDSLIQNNGSSGGEDFSIGGGVTNRGDALISGSTIADNRTASGGGGIANINGGSLLVTNSTVSGNSSRSGAQYQGLEASAGIVNGLARSDFPGGVVTLLNVTISGNFGGGLYNRGEIHMANTVIAGNFAAEAEASCRDVGIFTSLGHNIFDDKSACPNNPATDRIVTEASVFTTLLGPLMDNGGPTPTHALLPGSVAIDAGEDAVCADAAVGGNDQRGAIRPQGAHCDIGAYEGVADNIFVATKFTDSFDGVCDADCSLREAVEAANHHPGFDALVLSKGVYLLSIPTVRNSDGDTIDEDANAIGDLDITDDLTLFGAAATIDGQQMDRILEVLSTATVTLRAVEVRGGAVSSLGGGISNSGHLTLNKVNITENTAASGFATGHGGGLYNEGVLVAYESNFTGNSAHGGEASYGEGGGIRNDGTLTLYDSRIYDNTTNDDNDVGIGGGLVNYGTATLQGGYIAGNSTSANGEGGGIANRPGGVLHVLQTYIGANVAGMNGGGIANANTGQLWVEKGSVVENSAGNAGGGLYNAGSLILSGNQGYYGDLQRNHAFEGGGLYNAGQAHLNAPRISENYTESSADFRGHGGGIYNSGTLTMVDGRVEFNRVRNIGALASFGGGIYNNGALEISQSTISVNTTVGDHCHGGGIFNTSVLTVTDSTIEYNTAGSEGPNGDGGGLYSDGAGTRVILHNSTVSGNRSNNGGSGGGLWNSVGSTMTLINSTVSGNVSTGNGGGINNTREAGLLTILNSTVANNSASGLGGGLWNNENSILVYQNAIIAGNGDDCANEAVLTSQGHNLVGSETGCDSSAPGDLTVDPDLVFTTLLGPLLNNGGATPTHALLPGSPAIDAGDDGLCAAEPVNGVDQRGVPRLQGAQCDIGAYEYLPLVPANTLRIQALIDGRSQLIVHGNTAQWHHFDFAAPGRHEFVNRPTVINDTLWFPVWPDQPDAENRDCNCTSDLFTAAGPLLPTDGTAIGLSLIRSRGSVQIVQFPDAGNDYTLIVEFDDSESGSDTYSIDLTWGRTALFVSSSSSGRAGAVQFRDEDIVAYDGTTNTWQMLFDGSDLGVTKDVDAFVFLADGSLLLSFNAPTDVPGLGKVDDSDIVQFTPTQLGSTTAGSFTLYLRGADVGLTTDGEDIDAIGFTADGRLVVSTIGDFAVANLIGKDEDLIRLDDKTASVWSFLLDGSTVGLANEDVNGLWIDPVTGELYLTVKDSFAFGEGQATVPIDADDIFVCTPMGSGAITSCAYRLFWDSDGHDYGSENLNAIGLGVLPPSFVAAVQASSDASPTPEELAPDDDIDDLNLEESIHQLYLPLIEQ